MAEIQSNLAWDTLLELDRQPPGPLYARVTQAFRAAIRAGVLVSGSLLPPSRVLAADLRCSRWTVTEAYQQLTAEGYVEARVGSGTHVVWRAQSIVPGQPAPPGPAAVPALDLAPGLPDLRAFPLDRWLRAVRTATAAMPYRQLGYPAAGGEPGPRRVLADYLRRVRGAVADPEDITIGGGVVDAVTRLCRAARDAGLTAVAVEDPGWTRLREAIARTGLRVVPIPVDESGVQVDRLHRYPDVRLAVVSPAHQFPTGVVLAPSRRAELLDWAAQVDGLIVEDDYDAEFRYDRRPVGTLQGRDPARVALTGSVSKTLSPALRIGWMLTPTRWTRALRAAPETAGPAIIDQLALATFIDNGSYDRYLRAARNRYRTRRDALVDALAQHLPDFTVSGAAAGLHLLLQPPPGPDSAHLGGAAIVRRAANHGVRVACVEQYRVHHRSLDSALVLGYGNVSDADVGTAVSRLAEAVRSSGQPATSTARIG